MAELEKKNRKRSLRTFEGLDEHLADASAEQRPHSLSSAANETVASQGEGLSDKSKKIVEEAVSDLFSAHEEGRDLEAVYEHHRQALSTDVEVDHLNQRLLEEQATRGLEIFDTGAPPDATATDRPEDSDATPPESTDVPSLSDRTVALSSGGANPPEWSAVIKRRPTGDVNGKRYWMTDDGSVYIDSRTTKNPGNVPHRIAHGGKYVTISKDGVSSTLYWDKNANAFTADDPTPEIREAARQAFEAARTHGATAAEQADEATQLESRRTHTRERVERLKVSDEKRASLLAEIAAADSMNLRRVSQRISRIERRHAEKPSGDVAPEIAPMPISPELAIEPKKKKREEIGPSKADKKNKIANPDARPLSFTASDGGEFVVNGDTIAIKSGNTIRLANAAEIEEYMAGQQAALDQKKAAALSGAPKEQPKEQPAEQVPESTTALRDSFKEDMHEATGVTLDELLQRLARRHQGGGVGIPRIKQSGELRPEDLGLDPSLFERIQAGPFRGQFMHPKSKRLYYEAEVRDMLLRQRQREANQPPNSEQTRTSAEALVPPAEALIAPAPRYGVLPDFTQRFHTRERPRPIVPESAPTIDVILRDPKQQELFGEMLGARGREGLIAKYMALRNDPRAMTHAEILELNAARSEFAHRLDLAEEVRASLDQSDLEVMYKRNTGFALLEASLEPSAAIERVKEHVLRMFMRESVSGINQMVLSQRALRDIRIGTDYRRLRERAQKIAGDRRVDPERVDLRTVDGNFLNRMLKPNWRERIFEGLSTRRATVTLSSANENIQNMANVLGASLARDPSAIVHMVREATNREEKMPAVGEAGVASFKEAVAENKKTIEEIKPDELIRKAKSEEYRKAFRTADGKSWDQASEIEREETFARDHLQASGETERRRGWFSSWLSSLFDALVGRTRETMRSQGAFAHA